jgi:DNA-damage-inducible protein J
MILNIYLNKLSIINVTRLCYNITEVMIMKKDAFINVRVDEKTKSDVDEILIDLGINMSTAIDIYLSQILLNQGLPFEVKIPKKEMTSRTQELAKAINLTGGKTYPRKFNKIISLYAKGDIDYDVAIYAIKKEFVSV